LGIISACLIALLIQGVDFSQIFNSWMTGYTHRSGDESLDQLLIRGGIQNMLWTFSLCFIALAFGGLIEHTKLISRIMTPIMTLAHHPKRLVFLTSIVGIMSTALMGEIYLGILLTGHAFKTMYEAQGLARRMLSRVVEESTTLIGALIPWTTAAVFMSSCLGVSTLAYAPYALFNWMNILISFLATLFGVWIFKHKS
jgi:NhaC family Na+:H+ antiporter